MNTKKKITFSVCDVSIFNFFFVCVLYSLIIDKLAREMFGITIRITSVQKSSGTCERYVT
jgi:hypothetical protein